MTPLRTEQLRVWQRFHVRLGLSYGVLVLAVLTGLAWMVYQVSVNALIGAVQAQLRGVAVAMASATPAELAERAVEDPASHQALTAQLEQVLRAEQDIESVYILLRTETPGQLRFAADTVRHGEPGRPGARYDATQAPRMSAGLDGPVVEDQPYTDEFGTFLSGYAPLHDAAGRAVGLVGVDIQVARIQAMRGQLFRSTVAIYGISLLALVGVAVGVGRNLRGPLERLIAATSAVEGGELSARTHLGRSDEFGILGATFDHMAEGLQERELIRDTFGRYVSREVARRILSGPEAAALGGDLRELTILFSDLRGYSTLIEHLPADRVVGLMNAYFAAMSDVIEAHGGTIIEFLGDGILAVFGAPGRLPDHADRAVEAARAMVARLADLNQGWERDGVAQLWQELGFGSLGARIGVHTGQVVAGNLGSPRRMKYAVIGDAVNVASRVEGLNKALGTEMLFTEATRALLSPALAALAEDRGEHAVKGRAQPVRVYTLTGRP